MALAMSSTLAFLAAAWLLGTAAAAATAGETGAGGAARRFGCTAFETVTVPVAG